VVKTARNAWTRRCPQRHSRCPHDAPLPAAAARAGGADPVRAVLRRSLCARWCGCGQPVDETSRLPSTRRVALRARYRAGAGRRFISILPLASAGEERAAAAWGQWLDRVSVCVCVCLCVCPRALAGHRARVQTTLLYNPYCTIVLVQSTITLCTMCHICTSTYILQVMCTVSFRLLLYQLQIRELCSACHLYTTLLDFFFLTSSVPSISDKYPIRRII
jgi:hypothetical protein